MKRIFTFILAACMTLGMAAQEHLKFMDIPIDGNITEFGVKLGMKGIYCDMEKTIEAQTTMEFGMDCMVFKGRFFGYNAVFYVNYDVSTETVFNVKVCILTPAQGLFRVSREKAYDDLKQKFIQQYGVGKTSERNGHESLIWTVKSAGGDVLGGVELSIQPDSDVYGVMVRYTDELNCPKG